MWIGLSNRPIIYSSLFILLCCAFQFLDTVVDIIKLLPHPNQNWLQSRTFPMSGALSTHSLIAKRIGSGYILQNK